MYNQDRKSREVQAIKTAERREKILTILREAQKPVPAKELSTLFDVSRQVIVQDMAVIKASVSGIVVTNRGYVLQKSAVCSREFKVQHNELRTQEELNLIVDCGGMVKNVSISHRVYGRITADLEISSRQDVSEFLDRLADSSSTLIGSATSGYHYHLVEATNEERLDLIELKLKEAGLLVPFLPWELEDK